MIKSAKSQWILIINIFTISCLKDVNSACENVNNKVKCTSVSDISDTTLSQVKNIENVVMINILNATELRLSPNAFSSTSSLERLFIKFNQLDRIPPNVFENLPLKYLDLSYNNIKYIYPKAFSNLTNLRRLALKGNNLVSVPKYVYSNMSIIDLTLSINNISSIEDMALENLPNLEKLKLDHNKLNTIVIHKILTYPERLEILWLHGNYLTIVTNYILQNLSNLKVLNLGFNSISFIEPNSFQKTPKLETLVLTHNLLKEIDGTVFPRTGLDYLEKLYLDNNRLMFMSSSFVARLDNLKKITIVGNPWLCSCLDEVRKLLKENDIEEKCGEKYTNGERPICVSDNGDNGHYVCRHVYNEKLGGLYETYKKMHPLYILPTQCLF